MAFSPRFLDDIRDRAGLVDTIGRRVKLTRKGREQLGLCPFHNEKTPSFTVNEDKGFYHCFGCGAHGDVIAFVMNTENLAFPEAVEQLAGLAGLPMPVESPEEREREQRRAGLTEAVEAAAGWFEAQLRAPAGKAALNYLRGRGLDDETIARFRLGYAPGSSEALKQALSAKGFEEKTLLEAGLLKRPDDGRAPYAFFRDRVMFPIADKRGRTIGFGARQMGDARAAKYINSPETPLFHKGATLYNFDRAIPALREGAEAIVAEGYMDVIALDAAGFHGAVAPLGTALTEAQIGALWRHAAEPVLCFDGDDAGARAAGRAAERALPLLRPGRSLRLAMLPPGQDPDDLIHAGGAPAMRRVLDGARPMSEVIWDMEYKFGPLDTPERRADLEHRLNGRVRQIADQAVQDHYRTAFRDWIWRAFRGGRKGGARAVGRATPAPALANSAALRRRRQQIVLAALLRHPVLADEMDEALSRVEFDPDLDKLRRALQKRLAANPDLDAETIRRHLSQDGFANLVGALCADEVMIHAAFAREGAPAEAARLGVGEALGLLFQARRREELRASARSMSVALTEESEARFLAFRKDVEQGENQLSESGDEFNGRGDG
jgi:DNA primase